MKANTVLFADHSTIVRLDPVVYAVAGSNETEVRDYRLTLVDPPLIGDDPISYAPGQSVILSDKGTRKLYETLKLLYEPKQAAKPAPELGEGAANA